MIEHYMLGPRILLKYFFVRYNGAPSKNRQTQEKQNKANTIPTKKQKKHYKTNQRANKHRKNIACLIRNVVAHGFLFGIVDMVHFDLNFTIPWLKTLDI